MMKEIISHEEKEKRITVSEAIGEWLNGSMLLFADEDNIYALLWCFVGEEASFKPISSWGIGPRKLPVNRRYIKDTVEDTVKEALQDGVSLKICNGMQELSEFFSYAAGICRGVELSISSKDRIKAWSAPSEDDLPF